jgi:hypothetical protein
VLTTRVDQCLHCGCPCAVDAYGNIGSAFALRSACQHGMCGCHQLAEASASSGSAVTVSARGMRPLRPRVGRRV